MELLISQNVSMSYHVLRCINSSYYSLPRKVDSIRQAAEEALKGKPASVALLVARDGQQIFVPVRLG